MKIKLLVALLATCFALSANAQTPATTQVTTNFKDTVSIKKDTTYWQKSLTGGINFNQASFSNWTGGGVNSIAIGGILAGRALYEKDKTSWDNTADFQLGFITQGGRTRKAADQLILISVLGHKIAPHWDLFASGTFNTFFAPGYRYDKLPAGAEDFKVSNFFSPAQLTLAWGVAYKPSDEFSLRISPFAPRFTFLADDAVRFRTAADGTIIPDKTAKAYGVEAGSSSRSEWLALQLQAALNKKLGENVSLTARYQLYANYQTLDAIDHRIDILLTAKLNRYLSTTFGLIALYDKDFYDGFQLQQSLGIGLIYNASTFRKK